MSTAEAIFETSKEFKDVHNVTYPAGTKVTSAEPVVLTDPTDKMAYKVLVVGSSPLHHKIVWVNEATRKSLDTQELAYLNAKANAHG